MSNTQADRLAAQIKRALAAYEIPAHVQSSVSEDLAALAALAKQQASQDAQATEGGGISNLLTLVNAYWLLGVTTARDGRNPYTDAQHAKWGEIKAEAHRLATTPSAPQAAGAGSVAWARDWLIKSADSLDKAAARLRTWPGQEQEARARELAAVQIRGLLQLLNVEQMLAASPLHQVREQAALPAVDEYVNAKGFAVSEQWKRGFEHARMFLAQGTTPAAGVGEQTQAEPMSVNTDSIVAAYHRFGTSRYEGFAAAVRAILAEAGIKGKP